MSFSFKQLFKKDEQDYGAERTRLQFDQPQVETVSETDRNPQLEDSDGLSAEGVFTTPFSRIVEESPPSQSRSLPEVKSPFQIAGPDSGNPEFSGGAFPEPVSSSDPASSSGKELLQEEGDVVKDAGAGLFNSVPPCADVSASAGFYESVMETDADTPGGNPDPLSPGLCSSGESSVMGGGLPPVQRDSAASTIAGNPEAASSVTEPSWLADPEVIQSVPLPSRVDTSDVNTAAHEATVRGPAGEITAPPVGEDSSQPGEAPFPVTGSLSNNLQAEDAGSFGDDVASEQDVAFSSRVPDETPDGLPRSTNVAWPPEIGGQEHIPAFLENPDSLEDEGSVNRDTVSGFPGAGAADFPANGGLSSGGQSDEGQFPGIDPGMPNVPEFSAPECQGVKESRPEPFEPEQLPVPTEVSSIVDGEKELSVAGPWPFEDELVRPKEDTKQPKQPEPLESLSPLSSTLSSSSSSLDPVGESKVVQDEFPPIGDCNVGRSAGQATLRALLMTDGDIDGDMVVRHCAELEGIHECVVYTADGRIKSSSMPGGTLEIDGIGLLESVRTLASAFAAGSEGPVTVRIRAGLVSFFSCGDTCLGVLHSEEALKSGVQERLWLITGALTT